MILLAYFLLFLFYFIWLWMIITVVLCARAMYICIHHWDTRPRWVSDATKVWHRFLWLPVYVWRSNQQERALK